MMCGPFDPSGRPLVCSLWASDCAPRWLNQGSPRLRTLILPVSTQWLSARCRAAGRTSVSYSSPWTARYDAVFRVVKLNAGAASSGSLPVKSDAVPVSPATVAKSVTRVAPGGGLP
jgi:hypothetical protein